MFYFFCEKAYRKPSLPFLYLGLRKMFSWLKVDVYIWKYILFFQINSNCINAIRKGNTAAPASKYREIIFCQIIVRLSLDDYAISAKSRLSVLKDVIDLLYPICFYYDRIMDHIMTLRKPCWRRNIYADLNYILINFLPCLCILDYLVT